MADYIYLLETRLSPAQQRAVAAIRTVARENESTIFLTGGAVRDLTGGGSIRDLDLTAQGDVLRLKPALEAAGAEVVGEHTQAQRLFLVFPGGVRVELAAAMCVTWPKPGQPVYEPGSITDDLRSRDFTANAMAISLNEGSYGLLMDPLNGVADIENRELRLVSNYGFIEEPSRLIRAARLQARLGWQMEERTRQRYDTAKEEGYISALNEWNRGYELEEIFHEEDPLRVLRSLEAEGWAQVLSPVLVSLKGNVTALADLQERQGQLLMQGILAQSAALLFPLITAKLSHADVATLKGAFIRPGFVREIESLDSRTKEFAARFSSKEAAAPSAAWKMLHEAEPNLVLALAFSSKGGSVQTRLKTFLTESPTARQRIPYALLQEMRITPDLPGYAELLDRLFFELMDGKLSTPEEMKAFLEPYSPPAPPPPVNLRRSRAKKESRPSRSKAKKTAEVEETSPTVAAEEEDTGVAEGLMEPGTLTGPDRGTEPTVRVPLEGKVAPELGAAPLTQKAAKAPKKDVSTTPASDIVSDKASSPLPPAPQAPAAKAVSARKPAPVKEAVPTKTAVAPGKQALAGAKAPVKAASSTKGKPAVVKTTTKQVAAKTPVKQTVSTKKTAPVKAAPTRPAGKQVAPTAKKSQAMVKKASPPSKTAAAKKTAPAKKAAPVKATAKKATPLKAAAKKIVAKKAVSRR